MKRWTLFSTFLFLTLTTATMQGCDRFGQPAEKTANHAQKLANLQRQRDNASYELQLRQEELNKMEDSARRPGVVGVSKEWLVRKNQLQEEIIQLKVKIRDLDAQIATLKPNS